VLDLFLCPNLLTPVIFFWALNDVILLQLEGRIVNRNGWMFFCGEYEGQSNENGSEAKTITEHFLPQK
jgi:hypothetical protein